MIAAVSTVQRLEVHRPQLADQYDEPADVTVVEGAGSGQPPGPDDSLPGVAENTDDGALWYRTSDDLVQIGCPTEPV